MRHVKPYLLHLRPRSWPVVAAHVAVGYCIALPPSDWLTHAPAIMAAAGVWAIFLNGGTLAINSAFDRDNGDVGYLDDPPPPPPGLLVLGSALMLLGTVFAAVISTTLAILYAACAVLSWAYSCPPLRLKARAGFDIGINAVGYGGLTVYAGWAAVRSDATPSMFLAVAGYSVLFCALYPLTQLYQNDADSARGDRTFSVVVGRQRALTFSLLSCVCAFITLAIAVHLAHGNALLVAIPSIAWMAILIPWKRKGAAYPEKRGMYRALWAWLAADVAVVLAFAVR